MIRQLWKIIWQYPKSQTHRLYDSIIPQLSIYLREMKANIQTKSCTQMLIAPYICNSPKLETTQMPTKRQMNKQMTVYTYVFCGIVFITKKNQLLVHATTWMNCK